jgi:dinuclear metal center YbgI/SA1388 family protein
MRLAELTDYLDDFLRVAEVPDYGGALNGLQVENRGEVRRLAVAVDAALATIESAARSGADLLLVHHGLFWDGNLPVTDRRYRRLRELLANDIAVYAAHLPLDAHPEVGNNVVLARELGIDTRGTFGEYQGYPLGTWGELEIGREAFCARLDATLGGAVRMIAGGPERLRRVGIVTGGAGDLVSAAREAGLDAFVTGEGAHHNFHDAMEAGINLFFGGHYATETWGVRALAVHLEQRFGLPWTYIDHPTGL